MVQQSKGYRGRGLPALLLHVVVVALVGALTPGAALAGPAPGGFVDGASVYSTVENCASVIQRSPYAERGAGAAVGYYRDHDESPPLPHVGTPVAMRLLVAGLGVPCSEQWFVPAFALPPGVSFDRSKPVVCLLNDRPVAWCPQWEALAPFDHVPGAVRFRSPEPTGAWAAPAGVLWDFRLPIIADRPMVDARLQGYVKMFDGNHSPVLEPRVGLTVAPRGGSTSAWQRLPGLGHEIAVGADGIAWLLGRTAVAGGRAVFRWTGSGWSRVPGGAVDIAVDGAGRPWIVNAAGAVYQWSDRGWQRRPGAGRAVGVGADGSVWLVGRSPAAGGSAVFRWEGSRWSRVPGGAVDIAVDGAGRPWIVNAAGAVYRRIDGAWQRLPGAARTVAVGADGSAWIVGRSPVPGGLAVFRWAGSRWSRVPGGAVDIAVDAAGRPWIVNAAGAVYRHTTAG